MIGFTTLIYQISQDLQAHKKLHTMERFSFAKDVLQVLIVARRKINYVDSQRWMSIYTRYVDRTNLFYQLGMPKEEDLVKFKEWTRTQKHPIVIFADFEALYS